MASCAMLARLAIVVLVAGSVVALEGCATENRAGQGSKRSNAPTVVDLSAAFMAEGEASFYADSLAGRTTANGEKYDPEKRTCAHRTLPFGTEVVVEDVETGRTTRCRVNDRGPYADNRLIDLSMRGARELQMLERGVIRVRLRVVPAGES